MHKIPYRIPELDDIGQRIQQIVNQRNGAAKLVQVSPEKDVAEPTRWNNLYRHVQGAEYMAFAALPDGEARLFKVDIAKGIVLQTYGK